MKRTIFAVLPEPAEQPVMTVRADMLHCNGDKSYIGQTDNLDRRIARDQAGDMAGFTADHLPVQPLRSQAFTAGVQAREAKRRRQGRSRAKKLALIRGDLNQISSLAKKKGSRSTSSRRTQDEIRGISVQSPQQGQIPQQGSPA